MSNSETNVDNSLDHQSFLVGDSGRLYRLLNHELAEHEMSGAEDSGAGNYFKNLPDEQGAVPHLRPLDDPSLAIVCFLSNSRAARTEWRPETLTN